MDYYYVAATLSTVKGVEKRFDGPFRGTSDMTPEEEANAFAGNLKNTVGHPEVLTYSTSDPNRARHAYNHGILALTGDSNNIPTQYRHTKIPSQVSPEQSEAEEGETPDLNPLEAN